jgi:hypothetical protein
MSRLNRNDIRHEIGRLNLVVESSNYNNERTHRGKMGCGRPPANLDRRKGGGEEKVRNLN